ncbi:MAG TPA: exonuclease domain-containing protein [Candidatus Saccharimonadales bacterium]|nr:exonuclease domain-containing protein [Candidatus Saccharimonadales bacterium]
MKYNKFAFLDIETSGMTLRRDRIIEIGILRVENNKLVDTFQTLINPELPVSPFIEEMTGINRNSLRTAPLFSEVKEKVLELLDDCILVAHNARFDYGFLKREFSYLEHSFSMRHCCSVKLSRLLYPQWRRHNLDELITRLGFTCENRHRAFDDAKVLWDFFQTAQKEFSAETFEKALQTVMKRSSLPVGISHDIVDTLPETPGVYIFYGDQEIPLYIGKSINLRERVLSHFAADHTSGKEMQISQQIKHIEIIRTAGELGALFTEAKLIKERQPLYNKKLRNARKLIKLVKHEIKEGYLTISQETVTTITADEIENIVGIFKSKKQVEEFLFEVAKQHRLCHKLLGIEKTKTACFPYRLAQCKGACINKELPLAYNMRFIMAFSEKKIKPWPFNGPIAIGEENSENGKKEMFVIDKWCFLGSYTKEEDIITRNEETGQSHSDYTFDLDMYKILSSYLLKKENYKYVKQLNYATNVEERTQDAEENYSSYLFR